MHTASHRMASNANDHDQQGGSRRFPAYTFGHAGLVHGLPDEGDPADLSGGHASFAPGSTAVADFMLAESERAFLRTAIDMPPPAPQTHLSQLAPQAAALLSPAAAEQLRQALGQPQEFTAGRLFDKREAWLQELDPPAYVQRWLSDGYSEYLPRPVQYVHKHNSSTTAEHASFVTEQVQELVSIQAVQDVTALRHIRTEVAAILPLTVADPERRKKRLCWNGRHVNDILQVPSFKMEHAPKAASVLRPGDYLFTVDMKSGYHQIPLKPSFQRYCCFEWQGRVYRWRVMPFGLSSAPRAYTKLSRVLLKYWRRQGIRCSNFMDDFLFAAASFAEAVALRDRVLADMVRFGWHVSLVKSLLQPGQLAAYIGFEYITVPQPIVRIPARKITTVITLISAVMQLHLQGARVQGLSVARIAGHLQSMRFASAPVNLFTRALYSWMGTLPWHPDRGTDFTVRRPLSETAALELRFWQQHLHAWSATVITQAPFTHVLYTDACHMGWGGLLQRVMARQLEPAHLLASHMWEAVASVDSVYTELLGLHEALRTFVSYLAGQSVLHRTDSISTYWVVTHAGSRRSERLTVLARSIWLICLQGNISLACEYVGKDVIIRKGADALSRWRDDNDCALCPLLFAQLWHLCGPFAVDRFASSTNAQCNPHTGQRLPYCSRFLEPDTLGMDALTADWSSCTNYAFPPPSILDRVISLIQQQRACTLLIAPLWPSALWWPTLLALDPRLILLPPSTSPFVPRASGCHHPMGRSFSNPEKTNFAAFWITFPSPQVCIRFCCLSSHDHLPMPPMSTQQCIK